MISCSLCGMSVPKPGICEVCLEAQRRIAAMLRARDAAPIVGEREAFEAWWLRERGNDAGLARDPSGGYAYDQARASWSAWSARAALPSGGGAREAARMAAAEIHKAHPRCRECADHNGTCPYDNLPCNTQARSAAIITKHIPSAPAGLTEAATDVIAERKRQIEVEGWHTAHDDLHDGGGLAIAGACYAMRADRVGGGYDIPKEWPWDKKWWKPKSQRRDLVRAAALILAEIERLDRRPTP